MENPIGRPPHLIVPDPVERPSLGCDPGGQSGNVFTSGLESCKVRQLYFHYLGNFPFAPVPCTRPDNAGEKRVDEEIRGHGFDRRQFRQYLDQLSIQPQFFPCLSECRLLQRRVLRIAFAAGECQMTPMKPPLTTADQHQPQFVILATIDRDKDGGSDA